MRIANNTAYLSFLRDLQRTQESIFEAQTQVTSGKKVSKPSDDPVAASDIIRLTGEKAESDQFVKNIDAARSRLGAADSILDSVEQMLERVQVLGQSSLGNLVNATAFTTEIDGLRDQILSAANAMHAGRYIFGGSVTSVPPYQQTAGVVSYLGNSNAVVLQAGRNTTIQAQIPGSEIFTTAGVDVFATIRNLSTAIQAGNRAAIDTELGNLKQAWTRVSTARTRVGGYVNLADSLSSQFTTAGILRAQHLSNVQDADPAQSITQLTLSQTSLQATLAVGARIAQMSLIDYI